MSFQAMTWATEQKVPANEKLVLLMLANHTNGQTGRCDPSLNRLAEECGMSRDTVIRAMKRLEEKGLIRVIRRTLEGAQISNSYRLAMPGVVMEGGVEVVEVVTTPVAKCDRGPVAQCNGGSSTMQRGPVAGCYSKQEVEPGIEPNPQTPTTPTGAAARSGTSLKTKTLKPCLQEEMFNRFWSCYPRKVKKPSALKAFKKINPTEDLLSSMLKAVESQKKTDQWKKDNGAFIPHPSSWLNDRRWEDEPVESKTSRFFKGML